MYLFCVFIVISFLKYFSIGTYRSEVSSLRGYFIPGCEGREEGSGGGVPSPLYSCFYFLGGSDERRGPGPGALGPPGARAREGPADERTRGGGDPTGEAPRASAGHQSG